jgi:hypothetical protein
MLLPAAAGTVARATSHSHRVRWSKAVADARSYARSRSGEISFSVVDENGVRHGMRQGRSFAMASTFKVMLLDAYVRRHDVRKRHLRESEKDLLRPMIRFSDNVAATRVRDILGRGPIERLARHADMHSFRWDDVWGLSQTTARDQAVFMHRLQRLTPNRHWDYVKHLLSTITPSQRWGFGDVGTHGWNLFFKGGWGSGSGAVDHQVALLRRAHQHVGIAVMTADDPDHEYGKRTLRGIARRLLAALPRTRH